MKKTKLICTIGPSCMDEEKLKDLILSGMNVARLNLSHCSHDFAEKVVHRIRNLNKKLGTNVGIIVDTKGPEIRVGTFKDDAMVLNEGDTVILTPDKADGTGGRINISQRKLSLDLDIDTKILLDEGNMELIVTGIENANITCRVVRGGVLKNNKSINVPKVDLNIDFLSITDKSDILFASSLNVDFISLSFVRNANDVLDVNDMLISEKNEHTQIISKIECQSALDDLENIIKVSDGIMIARGDLGVEVELEKLPCIQKRIVAQTRKKNKMCIVSTQMLPSMENNLIPTRAEVSDVANAALDGVDAVMLNTETAMGKYPIEATKMMSKIIEETENGTLDIVNNIVSDEKNYDATTVLSKSAVDAANMLHAKAIVTSTTSGYTARRVSAYRPKCPIIAATPIKGVAESLSLNWGIPAVHVSKANSTDEIIEIAKEEVSKLMKIDKDDKIVVTGGFPIKKSRSTNFIKIEEM